MKRWKDGIVGGRLAEALKRENFTYTAGNGWNVIGSEKEPEIGEQKGGAVTVNMTTEEGKRLAKVLSRLEL